MQATIVTSYFKLNKSKASHDKYMEWMQNFLIIDNPMVIFCDDKMYNSIRTLRKDKLRKTLILVTSFEEFHCYKYSKDFLEHAKLDAEISVGHSFLLYMIWNEKSNFLKRAIDINPFNSDYFVWCDIGCFRRPNTEFLNWPNPARISEMNKDKVLLLLVNQFTEKEIYNIRLDSLPSFQFANRIGGTIFGGGRDVLLEWHAKYYAMLEHFISINRFIGKDQSIMNSVYLMNKNMVDIVNWKPECHDIWFYLQDYLK
jgi:hypothetical protein